MSPKTTPAERWAILDGQRVAHDAATVHVSDLGLRRGYAVFEAFRIEQGVPLFLEDHLARLARSALAIVQDGTLVTRREGVLASVSVKQLLAVARERMPVEERAVTLEELHTADEVLTTGSVRGVLPVTAIDGHPVGDATVGPHSRALFTAFAAHVDGYIAARRGGGATGT